MAVGNLCQLLTTLSVKTFFISNLNVPWQKDFPGAQLPQMLFADRVLELCFFPLVRISGKHLSKSWSIRTWFPLSLRTWKSYLAG